MKCLKISNFIVEAKIASDMTYEGALVLAMKSENDTYMLYKKLSTIANNPNIKALFNVLAQEEAKYKFRFEMEYDEYVYKENYFF